jgi:hypothetical protein
MKIPCYIFLLISFVSFSQNDFDSRYYTIDGESLPEIPQIPTLLMELNKSKNIINGSFTLGASPSYQETRNTFTISSSNYWQPVDMTQALASKKVPYDNSQFKVQQLQKKQFGFSVSGNGGETSFDFGDGETRVQNSTYQNQQRPFYIEEPQRRAFRPRAYPFYRNGINNW